MKNASRIVVAVALLGGCQGAAVDPNRPDEPTPPDIRAVVQVRPDVVRIEPSVVVGQDDLSALTGTLTGVAVEPDTGRRLVLTREGAIHEIGGSGLLLEEPMPNEMGFTDLVALGGGRVAVTSLGDGYLLELPSGSMTPHFCYEPGWWEPEGANPVQISQAVAYDARAGRIYAQPRTIENGGWGTVTESFVAVYDEAGGADLTWWTIEDVSFVATGMALLPSEHDAPRLVLGSGTTLHRFDVATGELGARAELGDLGIESIAGLAIDASAGTLLVLDAVRTSVVELRLSALALD